MSKPVSQTHLPTDSPADKTSRAAGHTPSGVAQPAPRALRALRKVPEVTVYFWIIKLLTTGMGESTSDYLVHQINPYHRGRARGRLAWLSRWHCNSPPAAMWRGSTGSPS